MLKEALQGVGGLRRAACAQGIGYRVEPVLWARQWLLNWLIEVPDISITICGDYLRPLFDKDKDYAKDIFFQMSFSSAAFIIEHPDQAKDDVAVNKAGIEGSLRAYEAIVKAKPKVKWPFLDELIQRREKGTLEEYVREISTTKCKETKK